MAKRTSTKDKLRSTKHTYKTNDRVTFLVINYIYFVYLPLNIGNLPEKNKYKNVIQ